jgi:hypothetical protein
MLAVRNTVMKTESSLDGLFRRLEGRIGELLHRSTKIT